MGVIRFAVLFIILLVITVSDGVTQEYDLPYHKANTDTTRRMQIRALTPEGVPNSALPAIAEKLAGSYSGQFFLIAFFDTREAVDRFDGSGLMNSLAEEKAWRCDVRVDRGRSDGTCKSWGGEDISSRNISGADLFVERGGTW